MGDPHRLKEKQKNRKKKLKRTCREQTDNSVSTTIRQIVHNTQHRKIHFKAVSQHEKENGFEMKIQTCLKPS